MSDSLSDVHKHYLLKEQIISPAAINFVANGVICWLLFRGAESINYWQPVPVATDLLLTALLLPLIMSMINSRLIAGHVRSGPQHHLLIIEPVADGWHQRSIFVRSLSLGALSVVLFAVPTVLILPLLWPEPLGLWGYVLFKASWAAILAVLVCPVIAVWAIKSASEHPR